MIFYNFVSTPKLCLFIPLVWIESVFSCNDFKCLCNVWTKKQSQKFWTVKIIFFSNLSIFCSSNSTVKFLRRSKLKSILMEIYFSEATCCCIRFSRNTNCRFENLKHNKRIILWTAPRAAYTAHHKHTNERVLSAVLCALCVANDRCRRRRHRDGCVVYFVLCIQYTLTHIRCCDWRARESWLSHDVRRVRSTHTYANAR